MPTVFVTKLAKHVRHSDVKELFQQAGRVRDVRLVMDRHTRRHKGAAYVEFYEREVLAEAVRLSGSILCGFPVEVKAWDEGGGNTSAATQNKDWRSGRTLHDRDRAPDGDSGSASGGGPGLGAGRACTDAPGSMAIGWSNRPPMKRMDPAGEGGLRGNGTTGGPIGGVAGGNGSGSGGSSATTTLVSVQELKALLNPKNLPAGQYMSGKGLAPGINATDRAGMNGTGGITATLVFVGGLSDETSSAKLRKVLSECGGVVWCGGEIVTDERGKSVKIGRVELVDSASAHKALALDGRLIDGKTIRVGRNRMDVATAVAGGIEPDENGNTGVMGGVSGDTGNGGADYRARDRSMNMNDMNTMEVDEGAEGGLKMNASRRMMLMQQLSRGEPVSGRQLKGDMNKLAVSSEESVAIMLLNMFDPTAEQDGFEVDVAEDVRDECAMKYGDVRHVYVEKDSHGVVYLRFSRRQDAVKARKCLDKRWFGGNQIVANFVNDGDYLKRFPKAA